MGNIFDQIGHQIDEQNEMKQENVNLKAALATATVNVTNLTAQVNDLNVQLAALNAKIVQVRTIVG